jgi:hypothetical protein
MNVALKEWSAVVAALASGSQTILLRKGGIIEAGRGGFQLRHSEFLLFPTFEHQNRRFIRPEFHHLFDGYSQEPDVTIAHRAEATAIFEAPPDPNAMMAASSAFVWNEQFVYQRYQYRPDLPLYIVELRVYTLAEAVRIPNRPSYAGCKSWINLTEEIHAHPSQPVLTNDDYSRRSAELRTLLQSR